MLTKGMTEQEVKEFDGSYIRSKRVLKKLNGVCRSEYLKILKEEEGVQSLGLPNYSEFIAYKNGQRNVWNKIQELTRTK